MKPYTERDFTAPDLGNPFQHVTPPEPVEFDLTTDELREARERQKKLRRDRNVTPRSGGDEPEAA